MEVDRGFIIALSIGIGLLVAGVIWAVWWFKRVMSALKDTIKNIARYLKR